MFIILAYDVEAKRNSKFMKTVKKYLHPVQKSVFEGHISLRNLNGLKKELSAIIEPEKDGIVIYHLEWTRNVTKEFIGKHRPDEISIL